jgi:pimeloyl-ACP methyl ester carboxylesterase
MMHAPQGLQAFLRGYYHHKSADWAGNTPSPLTGWTASELAKLPTYYVMDGDADMAATVVKEMPTPEAIAACQWLPDRDLAFYVGEYSRTGFQGGLQWYRHRTTGISKSELELFSGRCIDVPACFISGRQDWGNFQVPGAIHAMQTNGCSDFRGLHFIERAGHWVQQEQPVEVSRLLVEFLEA